MITNVCQFRRRLIDTAQDHIKRWLKPNPHSSAVGAAADLARSKADLIAENALLRQQFIILQRQYKRPQPNNLDCIKLLLLARTK